MLRFILRIFYRNETVVTFEGGDIKMKTTLFIFTLAFAQNVFASDWKIIERRSDYIKYKNLNHDTHSKTLVLHRKAPGTAQITLYSKGQPVLDILFTVTDFPVLDSFNELLIAFRKYEPTIPDFRQEFLHLLVEN